MRLKTGAAAVLAAAMGFGTLAQAETIQFAHFLPEQFPPNMAEKAFAEAFNAGTNGEFEIEFAFGGVMGGQKEMLDFVANNIVGMASFPSNHYLSQFPGYEGFGVPMTYGTAEEVGELFQEAYDTLPKLRASYDEQNVVPFMFRGLDPYVLLCNKPVTRIADFQGLKVRTFGSAFPGIFEELGAVAVNTQTSEIYEAMQRGTVDCAIFSRIAHMIYKMHEVSKYYIDFDFGAVASYLDYVNKDVYDGWTDDQRAAFHAASDKGVEVGNQVLAKLVAQSTELFTTKLERLTIEDGDKIREMFPASQMLDDYVVQMAGIGASQKEVADEVRAFLREKLGQ